MRYLKGPFRQNLLALQPEIDEALEAYVATEIDKERNRPPLHEDENKNAFRAMLQRIVFFRNLRQRLGLVKEASDISRVVSDETMALLSDVFAVAKATVDSWGGELHLVYLPERDRYTNPTSAKLAERKRERILGLASDLHVPIIDIHSAIQAHADPLSLFPFRRRGHYNEEGYRLVAETVLESISDPVR